MKRLAAILPLLLLLAALFGCGGRTRVSARLDALDTLVTEHPDSVLAVLSSLSVDSLTGDEERAHYGLLLTMAHDKLYHPHTSDSLMVRVADYYDRHGSSHERALAHFYLASVCRDLGRQPDMLRHLLRAEFYGEDGDDANLLSMIYCNEGYVYYWNDFYEECDSAFFRAQRLAEVRGDTLLVAEMLCQRSANLLRQGKPSGVDRMLNRAESLAKEMQCQRLLSRIYTNQARFFNETGRDSLYLAHARKAVVRAGAVPPTKGQLFHLGYAYRLNHKPDSAKHYLQLSIGNDSTVNADAYLVLADMYKEEQKVELSNAYERMYSSCLSKAGKDNRKKDLVEVLRQVEDERNRQRQQRITCSALGVLFLCIVCMLFVFVTRKRHRRIVVEMIEERNKMENRYRSAVAKIQQEDAQKRNLQQAVMILSDEKRELQQSLAHTSLFEDSTYHQLLRAVSDMEKFEESTHRLDEGDWNHLLACLGQDCKGYETKVRRNGLLTNEEKKILCMMKLDIQPVLIEKVLMISHKTLYRRFHSISHKIGLDGDVASLKSFVNLL